jgi:hypothetical protein
MPRFRASLEERAEYAGTTVEHLRSVFSRVTKSSLSIEEYISKMEGSSLAIDTLSTRELLNPPKILDKELEFDSSELKVEFQSLKKQFRQGGIFVGVNYEAIRQDGLRIKGKRLLKVYTSAEWRTMIATLPLLGLTCTMLRHRDGEMVGEVEDVPHEGKFLAGSWFGIEVADGGGRGSGDPRALMLSRELNGPLPPTAYVALFVRLQSHDDWGELRNVQNPTTQNTPHAEDNRLRGGEPLESSICQSSESTSFKPETIYSHPNGGVRTIPAGFYTEFEFVARSIHEQDLLIEAQKRDTQHRGGDEIALDCAEVHTAPGRHADDTTYEKTIEEARVMISKMGHDRNDARKTGFTDETAAIGIAQFCVTSGVSLEDAIAESDRRVNEQE